jgi:hypothetical protein
VAKAQMDSVGYLVCYLDAFCYHRAYFVELGNDIGLWNYSWLAHEKKSLI